MQLVLAAAAGRRKAGRYGGEQQLLHSDATDMDTSHPDRCDPRAIAHADQRRQARRRRPADPGLNAIEQAWKDIGGADRKWVAVRQGLRDVVRLQNEALAQIRKRPTLHQPPLASWRSSSSRSAPRTRVTSGRT